MRTCIFHPIFSYLFFSVPLYQKITQIVANFMEQILKLRSLKFCDLNNGRYENIMDAEFCFIVFSVKAQKWKIVDNVNFPVLESYQDTHPVM